MTEDYKHGTTDEHMLMPHAQFASRVALPPGTYFVVKPDRDQEVVCLPLDTGTHVIVTLNK